MSTDEIAGRLAISIVTGIAGIVTGSVALANYISVEAGLGFASLLTCSCSAFVATPLVRHVRARRDRSLSG